MFQILKGVIEDIQGLHSSWDICDGGPVLSERQGSMQVISQRSGSVSVAEPRHRLRLRLRVISHSVKLVSSTTSS
jgi:hypothetical protein